MSAIDPKKKTALQALTLVVVMGALAWASVPFYDWFCRVTGFGGVFYLTIAIVLNAQFLWGAIKIWRRDEGASEADNFAVERKFFKLSLLYLFAHFGAILLEAGLTRYGIEVL